MPPAPWLARLCPAQILVMGILMVLEAASELQRELTFLTVDCMGSECLMGWG